MNIFPSSLHPCNQHSRSILCSVDWFPLSWQAFTPLFFFLSSKQHPELILIDLIDFYYSNAGSLMRPGHNQKGKGKATFQSHPLLLTISPEELHSQISPSEQLQRMHGERCIIHPRALTVGEKQECLLSGGAIYHGKYVYLRPVKGWWFCSIVTSDIRLYAGRGPIKATSITQPDNLSTQEKQMMLSSQLQ